MPRKKMTQDEKDALKAGREKEKARKEKLLKKTRADYENLTAKQLVELLEGLELLVDAKQREAEEELKGETQKLIAKFAKDNGLTVRQAKRLFK